MCLEIKEVKGKVCTKCGTFKEFSKFGRRSAVKDGYRSECKECKNTLANAINLKRRTDSITFSSLYKVCLKCNVNKFIYEFQWRTKNHDSFYSYCKTCTLELGRTESSKQQRLQSNLLYRHRTKEKLLMERLEKGIQPGDCILYVLKFWFKENPEQYFFKIGVTKNSVSARYSGYFNFEYKILDEYYFSEESCYTLEQKLLYEHRMLDLQYEFPEGIKFDGYTECFKELNEDIINKYVKFAGMT